MNRLMSSVMRGIGRKRRCATSRAGTQLASTAAAAAMMTWIWIPDFSPDSEELRSPVAKLARIKRAAAAAAAKKRRKTSTAKRVSKSKASTEDFSSRRRPQPTITPVVAQSAWTLCQPTLLLRNSRIRRLPDRPACSAWQPACLKGVPTIASFYYRRIALAAIRLLVSLSPVRTTCRVATLTCLSDRCRRPQPPCPCAACLIDWAHGQLVHPACFSVTSTALSTCQSIRLEGEIVGFGLLLSGLTAKPAGPVRCLGFIPSATRQLALQQPARLPPWTSPALAAKCTEFCYLIGTNADEADTAGSAIVANCESGQLPLLDEADFTASSIFSLPGVDRFVLRLAN
uniref:Uncharacterized protein n=1 Tax=Macrostomum lignano TaxID=282301 RepID=A0A1I8F7K0_9PLAT